MKLTGRLIIFTILLIVLATACKFFFGPNLNWSGFSPVIAIALFSGMVIKQRNISFLLPLVALFASDLVIQLLYEQNAFRYAGIYNNQWKNYLILLSTATLIGWLIKGKNYRSLLLAGTIAPTVFFLVSNFNVWLNADVVYSRSFDGLMNCYAAGLPFYKNALIGTLVFLPVILLIYNGITRQKPSLIVA